MHPAIIEHAPESKGSGFRVLGTCKDYPTLSEAVAAVAKRNAKRAAKAKTTPRPKRRHRMPEGYCPTCDRERERGNDFHPPHDASRYCESGHRNHCSCEVCF